MFILKININVNFNIIGQSKIINIIIKSFVKSEQDITKTKLI